MTDKHDDISDYAKGVGVDPDTALAHLLLFEVVGATRLDDEKQKEAFDTLLNLVDPHKLAAFVRKLAMQLAAPVSPDGTESPANSAAEGHGYSWSPGEEVWWDQVAAAIPDEAATFEAVLDAARLDIEEFCRWRDGTFELGDESDDPPDDEDLPVDEAPLVDDESLGAAWRRLSEQFEQVTGLRLYTYCYYRSDYDDDPDTGFEVVGAWQRSPAGKRFFAAGRNRGDRGEGGDPGKGAGGT